MSNIFEIVNPSDKCFIEHSDPEIACLAISILGKGQYGAACGDFSMPIFLFGGHDEWWNKEFGHSFEDGLYRHPKAEISKALASFRYAGERTSMNNIGEAAKSLAEALAHPQA